MKKLIILLTIPLATCQYSRAGEPEMETVPSRSVSVSSAERIALRAQKKAQEMGLKVSVAVVDASGHLIYFRRMDGTKVASIKLALDKAYTSAIYRKKTGDLAKPSQPGAAAYGLSSCPRTIVFKGGVPLLDKKGNTVGAIGVSGASASQDEQVALSALQP